MMGCVNPLRRPVTMIPWRHMVDARPARWCVLVLAFTVSCRRSRHAGAEESAASEARPVPTPAWGDPVARVGDVDGGALFARGSAPSSRKVEPTAAPLGSSEPVGGRWVSCYANYRPTNTPERDVERLGAACGPPNGMVAVGPAVAGDAVDGAEDHRLDARAGDCFRIFAVADAFVGDLGIEVINSRGKAVTYDRNGDRWPILNPDGPFCLFETGTYTVRVRALQGKGRYAIQIWRLP